jgi:hypothetical protein
MSADLCPQCGEPASTHVGASYISEDSRTRVPLSAVCPPGDLEHRIAECLARLSDENRQPGRADSLVRRAIDGYLETWL